MNGHNVLFFPHIFARARPIAIPQGLSDQKSARGDIVQLEVKVSLENVEGVWMKDGEEVQPGDRVHIVIDKQSHMLLIEDMTKEDAGHYLHHSLLDCQPMGAASVYTVSATCTVLDLCCRVSMYFQQKFVFTNLPCVWFCRC